MKVKKGLETEVTVDKLAFGGRGVARIDKLAVFVEGAAPQERARIRITRKRKNYAEARMLEVISPSPERISAPCPYSGVCGGCKWQFLAYGSQLQQKRQHVADALARIGNLKDVPVHPTIASPTIFGYRNKMEFTCSDRRWLMPEELASKAGAVEFGLGLHVPGTFFKVLDLDACLLQPDDGNRLMDMVRQFIKQSSAPVYNLRSHEGFWRFLVLRHSRADNQWMVNIVTSTDGRGILAPLAEQLVASGLPVTTVVNAVTARKAGVATGEQIYFLTGNGTIEDRIGPYRYEISPNSFFQTNTAAAQKLYDTVKRFARLTGTERVLDLYSGTGTIPIWLSSQAREIVGLEIVESAVLDAHRNCERNGIGNCRFEVGDIRERLPAQKNSPDVMIIDPPRAGMHPDVVDQVMALAPARIVYVSCNPTTLARDLALLQTRYRVAEAQPVDMFPHTYHVEVVARLERN